LARTKNIVRHVPWPLPRVAPLSFIYSLWYRVLTGRHVELGAPQVSQYQGPCTCKRRLWRSQMH